jgi:hypothetical protein
VAYVPPRDDRARNLILGGIALVALVIIAFVVGALVHRSSPADLNAAQTHATPIADSNPRATVTLVPVEGGASMQSEAPVTSAPVAQPPSAGNLDVNDDRSDATALPSDAYAAAAQRAKAERAAGANGGVIDPRTFAGGVGSRLPRGFSRAQSRSTHVAAASLPHTQPVPIYQPVPPLQADRPTNARLFLTVGPDGRVRDINIGRSIPGEMPRLIASVQNWRFRPATLNGEPVTSTFSVDINVNPR